MIKGTDRYLYFFRHLKYEILLRRSLRTWNKKKRRRRKIEGKKKIPLFLKSKTTRQQFNPSSKIQRIRTITGKIFRAIKQETRKRLTRLHCLKHNRASSREFHADLTNVNVEVSMRRVTFQPRSSPCIKKTWLSKAICFFPVLFPLSPVSSNRLDNHHWSLPRFSIHPTPIHSLHFHSFTRWTRDQRGSKIHRPGSIETRCDPRSLCRFLSSSTNNNRVHDPSLWSWSSCIIDQQRGERGYAK